MLLRASRAENLEPLGTRASNSDREVAGICRDLSEGNSTQSDLELPQPAPRSASKTGGTLKNCEDSEDAPADLDRQPEKRWGRDLPDQE